MFIENPHKSFNIRHKIFCPLSVLCPSFASPSSVRPLSSFVHPSSVHCPSLSVLCPSFVHPSRMFYPPWILKLGGLENSGQRLIYLNSQTKIFVITSLAKFLSFKKKIMIEYFLGLLGLFFYFFNFVIFWFLYWFKFLLNFMTFWRFFAFFYHK